MRSNTSLLGRIFLWIASKMLEILTIILKRILNYNPRKTRRARIIGSSKFRRMLNGYFLVARAQEIFGGNLL